MTDLDAATTPGPENTYPADAGEFAARWNEWTTEQREDWVQAVVRGSEERSACFMRNHEGQIHRLRADADHWRGMAGMYLAAAKASIAATDAIAAKSADGQMRPAMAPVADAEPASARLDHQRATDGRTT